MARTKSEEEGILPPTQHESEKVRMFNDWSQSIDTILKEKTKEKNSIEQQIMMAKIELQTIQESKVRETSQFEQKKRQDMLAFENLKNSKMQEIDKKAYSIQINEQNMVKRLQDVEDREKRVADLEDIKHKLSLERIKIEQLAIKADSTMKEANSKLDIADDKYHKSKVMESESKEAIKKNKSHEESLNSREDKLKEERAYVDAQLQNIEKVRSDLTPRMEELKKLEDKIQNDKKELDDKIRDLNDKIAQEKNLLNEVDSEKKGMELKKRELNQREEEFKRKTLLHQEK